MLEIQIVAPQLRPGEVREARLVVAATEGACRNVVFELWFSPGLRGSGVPSRVTRAEILPDRPAEFPLRLRAESPGEYRVEIRSLSFRSPTGRSVNGPVKSLAVRAEAAPGSSPESQPALVCEWSRKELAVGKATQLEVRLINRSARRIARLTLDLQGPLARSFDDQQIVVSGLPPGKTVCASAVVTPKAVGPATLDLVLQWISEDGQVGGQRLSERFDVSASSPESRERRATDQVRRAVILFVAAEPRLTNPAIRRNMVGASSPGEGAGQNPVVGGGRLRLDYEYSRVRSALAAFQDALVLEHLPAAQFAGLASALLQVRPHYLHLSCHGTPAGELLFEDESSRSEWIPTQRFSELLRASSSAPRCVFLNGCSTASLIPGMADTAQWLIGAAGEVTDTLAIEFARAFYEGIAGGIDVPQAFARARSVAGAGQWYHLERGRRP